MEEELFGAYCKMADRFPLLNAQEEKELAKRVASGDKSAVEKLVNSNLKLVICIARKFSASDDCIMDIIQEGSLGLLNAAEKYNENFNTRFSTYAYPWVLQYMVRFINNKNSLISIPHKKEEFIRRVENAQSYIYRETGHEATSGELAQYLDVEEKQLKKIMAYSYSVKSLDAAINDEDKYCLSDILADTKFSPEANFMTQERKRIVREILSLLSESEQKVLKERFNFGNNFKPKTLREIAEELHVSAETVRQIEFRGLKNMRKIIDEELELILVA